MHAKVAIVGAGPAGLMLSHLLHQAGIDSIIVESRSRAYCETRVRAGVIEHWAADLMRSTGVGERMAREGLIHRGIHLNFGGALHHLDFEHLTGQGIVVYGQHEVVKDLIARRLADGGQILFEAEAVSLHDLEGPHPRVRFRHDGRDQELTCDVLAGCDGFHGICRPAIPDTVLTAYDRTYPFGWLGILAQAPPISEELIYCYSERGFALFSMRSPTIVRLYLQCDPDEDIALWPDDRIWAELRTRLGPEQGPRLREGPVLQKGITAMRSFVAEPMQYGRLFLAGDAAHIVPPTGAKGMNLAFADVLVLSRALEAYFGSGREDLLQSYSNTCLRRVWKAQRFSWWMTSMLHVFPQENPFDRRRQLAELDYVTSSRAASTALAENYVGLPLA
jgi:p-hydroxybenzoate 3-monooxygenase